MGCLAFDPKAPDINDQHFYNNANWKEFYGNVEKELPPNMPKPQGHLVSISTFVDANHAGNVVTQCLHSTQEAAAARILQVGKEDRQTNLADLLTKILTSERHWEICWNIMW